MRIRILKLTRLPRLGEVQAARARVTAARARWTRTRLGNCALAIDVLGNCALAIDVQAHAHPLACVGAAAAAGLALGWLPVRPLRIVGVTSLLYKQAAPWIARLLTMPRDDDVR